MKKILLLSALFIALTTGASAQKLFSFGPKIGVNFATATGLEGLIERGKTNVVGGLYAEVRPLKWLGASIEALYSSEGFVTKDIQIEDWNLTMDMSLGYIAIPIMAKIYVVGGLAINVGYQPSFLISSKISIGGSQGAEIESEKFASTIPVGLSYSFRFGLMVDLRYNIGISDVNPVVESDEHMQNRVWSLTVGWKF